MTELSASAQKVQDALTERGYDCQVIEMKETTRTAQDAAIAVGCEVGQIVKSLIFINSETKEPILVVASGANRVNTGKLSDIVSGAVKMADVNSVRKITGYAIGGVPPVGHQQPLRTYIDEDLMGYDEIWAAAGNPNAMFKLSPEDLKKMTGGDVVSIR